MKPVFNSESSADKEKIMHTHHTVFLILTISWMILIFFMSSQPAPKSTKTSLTVGRTICSIFVPGYRDMNASDQLHLARRIDHPVRKTAHATEYAILAILLMNAVTSIHGCQVSLLISVDFAISDEIHQYFVPGRACMVGDVLIDSCGAAAGLLIIILFRKVHG